jgi:uncharacterized protein YwlG (UPF0340 family)
MADDKTKVAPGKRVQIDDATWASLDLLGKDRMMTFQECQKLNRALFVERNQRK